MASTKQFILSCRYSSTEPAITSPVGLWSSVINLQPAGSHVIRHSAKLTIPCHRRRDPVDITVRSSSSTISDLPFRGRSSPRQFLGSHVDPSELYPASDTVERLRPRCICSQQTCQPYAKLHLFSPSPPDELLLRRAYISNKSFAYKQCAAPKGPWLSRWTTSPIRYGSSRLLPPIIPDIPATTNNEWTGHV